MSKPIVCFKMETLSSWLRVSSVCPRQKLCLEHKRVRCTAQPSQIVCSENPSRYAIRTASSTFAYFTRAKTGWDHHYLTTLSEGCMPTTFSMDVSPGTMMTSCGGNWVFLDADIGALIVARTSDISA
eukprot:PhF_6_TR14110/c0_g1_i2/m.22545